jgi:hypothetical protein
LLRHIAALIFIFGCTSIAWVILGATITERTHNNDDQLKGHVASTWGTAQEQAPPCANLVWKETVAVNTRENGNTIVRNEQVERTTALPLDSTRLLVNLKLDHRQKGLLWYSTYLVDFAGDYDFRNTAAVPGTLVLRLPFPAQKALYDGLTMTFNGQPAAFPPMNAEPSPDCNSALTSPPFSTSPTVLRAWTAGATNSRTASPRSTISRS